ncbi:MAG TPA: 1-deoxy-D-xylulose-5-phosphate reductoisomerase, partial [Candidatus Sumerlaeota bacterium]|nr:1-deoxy-D-xylulose-5-phosphate reductoisomerase [Candidatus Sumerlaeota bacterium]
MTAGSSGMPPPQVKGILRRARFSFDHAPPTRGCWPPMTFQSLTLLGSTGSIGRQTLDVVRHLKGRIAVAGLSAGGRDLHTLVEQIIEFQPAFAHIARAEDVSELREKLRGRWSGTLLSGEEGLSQIAAQAGGELVLVATVGWTGLAPTLA